MSEFIAGAFVDVRAETKNFRADLKRKLDQDVQSRGAVKIPVELDPKRLKSTIQKAARDNPAKIPIEISTTVTSLRAKIKKKIDEAVAGLKISVPVVVEQTPTAAKAAATGAATGAAGTAAQTKAAAASTAATNASTAAKTKDRAAAVALARAEKDLALAENLGVQALTASTVREERQLRLREARAASSRAVSTLNKALAASEIELAAAREAGDVALAKQIQEESALLASRLAEAQTTRIGITSKAEELGLATSQARAIEESVVARELATAAISTEVKSLTTLNEVHLAENQLSAIEARLKKQTAIARRLEVDATVAENTAMLESIALRKEALANQRRLLLGETAFARTQKTAARGFGATILSLFGLRGATLAASTAFLAGAVGAAVFAKSIKSFADFQTQLNVFQATAGATVEQMKQVSETAKELGADITLPGVSAGDAAEAMTQLARAGLSVEDSIEGARGVLQLATAAQISNADAADLAASALNAFGLSGEQAIHVADLLANAANSSQGSITEMAAALQQASAIARQVGLSLDNTVAILTQFARNGLRGSDAGTSLRTALSRLIAPTKQASDLIAALGLNLRDAQGNIRPDVFAQFGRATENLSPALRDMIAETIAGQDAIRAFAIGSREGARGLRLAQLQMEQEGSAAALAAARTKGLAGDFGALGSNAETLGVQLGKLASGPVVALVKGLNATVTVMEDLLTLNFGDLADVSGKALDQAGRNFEQFGKGIAGFFTATNRQDLAKSVKDLFTFAPPKDNRINDLLEALNRLQSLRVQSFEIGADIGPITAKIKQIRKELHDAKVDAGLIIPVTPLEKALAPLETAKKTAQDLKKDITESATGPVDTRFLDQLLHNIQVREKLIKDNFGRLGKDIEKQASGLDIAKSFQKQFELIAEQPKLATPEVLGALDDLARKIKGKAPLTGASAKRIGTEIIKSINTSIKNAVEQDDPDTARALKALAEKIANLFGVNLAEAFRNIKVPLTAQELEDALLPQRIRVARAQAFGTVDALIAAKQAELAARKKQLQKVVKGSQEEETILNQISSLEDDIASLREQQAQDAKDRRDKADKSVTDAIGKREQGFLNRLTRAQATETLRDDIRRQRELRAFYVRELAVVRATVQDTQTRNDQIDALNQKIFQLDQDIITNQVKRRTQRQDRALARLDQAEERAQETETLADDLRAARRRVRFWKRRVAILKNLVSQGEATADEVTAASQALNEAEDKMRQTVKARREQQRDLRRQGLELDIEFAQTIGTETNHSAEIAARRRFIAFLETQRKFVKGNTIKMKQLRNDIAAQKKAIKDLENEGKNTGGTTLADLFRQQTEIVSQAGFDLGPQIPFNVERPIGDEVQRRLQQRLAAIAAGKITDSTGLSNVTRTATDDVTKLGGAADDAYKKIKKLFVVGHPAGLIKAGNIDLLHRQVAKLKSGAIATVKSFSVAAKEFGRGKGEILLPQVVGGKVVSRKQAIQHFIRTGENLGQFSSVSAANKYADQLHKQQADYYQNRAEQSTSNLIGALNRLTTAVEAASGVATGGRGSGVDKNTGKSEPKRSRYYRSARKAQLDHELSGP